MDQTLWSSKVPSNSDQGVAPAEARNWLEVVERKHQVAGRFLELYSTWTKLEELHCLH